MVRLAILLLFATAARVGAQIVESPVPFDSAGRVRILTPTLVARLQLAPPVWPVEGPFVQARLFAVSLGGHVLVAEHSTGALERHVLTDEQVATLRYTVGTALGAGGARAQERPDLVSQQARGAFVRNQMILAAGLYGPLLASLSDDGKTATAFYLISIGGSYFALNNIPKTTVITRAQTDLSTDGALRGAATALGIQQAFGARNPSQKAVSAAALSGAIVGTVAGYHRGVGLTDAEAHASISASTFAAGIALGVHGATQPFDGDDAERVVSASMVGAGLAGYFLGPRYPRRATYTVTAGDVKLLTVGAALGVMAGVTPFVEGTDDARAAFTGATLGGIAGIVLTQRQWAQPFDHGSSDVTQVWLGTIAGALLGGAAAVLVDPGNTGVMALVTGGGMLGATAGHRFADPERAGPLQTSMRRDGGSARAGSRVSFDPAGIGFAAARVPGMHSLLSIRF